MHDDLVLKLLIRELGSPLYIIKTSVKSPNGNLSKKFPYNDVWLKVVFLSPLLLNIFINTIIPYLLEQLLGCLLYADDLVIIFTFSFIVKKVSAKENLCIVKTTGLHIRRWVFANNF